MKKTNIDNDAIALTKVKKIYNELIESCNKFGYNIAEFKITGCEYDENIIKSDDRESVRIGLNEGYGYFIPLYDDIKKLYYLAICGCGWKCTLNFWAGKEYWTSTSFKNFLYFMRNEFYKKTISKLGKAAYKIKKIDTNKHLKECGHYYIKNNEIRSIFGGKL